MNKDTTWWKEYEPVVQVVLSCTGDYMAEDEVEFMNIEGDLL